MKLYIKQKTFSLKERFSVYDEAGNERYYIEGEFFTLGKKLHIYDVNGNETAYIEQKVFSLLPRFYVFMAEGQMLEIEQKFTFFKPSFNVKGPDWKVSGSFLAHDYEIFSGDSVIASIHKVWMSWGDTFEISIADNEDERIALAVVIAIDYMTDRSNN